MMCFCLRNPAGFDCPKTTSPSVATKTNSTDSKQSVLLNCVRASMRACLSSISTRKQQLMMHDRVPLCPVLRVPRNVTHHHAVTFLFVPS